MKRNHLDLTLAMFNINPDVLGMANQGYVDHPGTDLKVFDFQLIDRAREVRVVEVKPGRRGVNPQAQTGLEQQKD